MKPSIIGGRWPGLVVLAAALLLAPACQRRPYRITDPQGRAPQPRVRAARTPGNEAADGRALDMEREALQAKKKGLDKNGLVKKPKLERRRLKRKSGPRRILGVPLPF